MYLVFIHGPAASGKHTIGMHLSALTGLPLFHNHLAVDAAKALFPFGTDAFNRMRATIWRTAFAEAASAGRSFIFTFHPESSVSPALIEALCQSIRGSGGRIHFIELTCTRAMILERLGNTSRSRFGKLTDPALYQTIEEQGGFAFPALPRALLTIETSKMPPELAAREIAHAVAAVEENTWSST